MALAARHVKGLAAVREKYCEKGSGTFVDDTCERHAVKLELLSGLSKHDLLYGPLSQKFTITPSACVGEVKPFPVDFGVSDRSTD